VGRLNESFSHQPPLRGGWGKTLKFFHFSIVFDVQEVTI
jgi:hypothetical protein